MLDEQSATAVEVITLDHQYTGLIETRGRRLADLLSDGSFDVIEMHQALVRTANGNARAAELRCERILLMKKVILMVIPTGSHEAPIRRHNNYQQKHPYGVALALGGHLLTGTIHLPTRANSWMLFSEAGLPGFFGLTDVSVLSSPHPSVPEHCPTAIINRYCVESIELSAAPLPDKGLGIGGLGVER